MEYRILGKTGLKISRLGFGGIPIQKTSAEATKKLVGALLENGVNFIDTSTRIYGQRGISRLCHRGREGELCPCNEEHGAHKGRHGV